MKVPSYFFFIILIGLSCCQLPGKESISLKVDDVKKDQLFKVNSKHSSHSANVFIYSDVNKPFTIELSNGKRLFGPITDLGKNSKEELGLMDWYDEPMIINYQGDSSLNGSIEIEVIFFH